MGSQRSTTTCKALKMLIKKHPQFTEIHENLGGNYVDILNKQLNINVQELIKKHSIYHLFIKEIKQD